MLNGRFLFSTSTATPTSGNATGTSPNIHGKIPSPSPSPGKQQVADVKILRTLASYLWMKDNFEFRFRVIAALSLLVGAKVLNVQVPFLFKLAVDWLTNATGNAAALSNPTLLALFATPASLLIGYGIARSGASAFNGLYLIFLPFFYILTLYLQYIYSFSIFLNNTKFYCARIENCYLF